MTICSARRAPPGHLGSGGILPYPTRSRGYSPRGGPRRPPPIYRLDLEISHALERRQTDDLLQIRLGLGVPVQGGALAAFLVVHDDLQRQASAAGPLGIGRHLAVPDEVARVLSSGGASTAPSDLSTRPGDFARPGATADRRPLADTTRPRRPRAGWSARRLPRSS